MCFVAVDTGLYLLEHLRDVSPAAMEAYRALVVACSMITRKSFTQQQLVVTLHATIRAVVLVERYLPVNELDMKLHSLIHATKRILSAGPLHTVSMWQYESMWKLLMMFATNKAYPEATMTHTASDLELAINLQLRAPEGLYSSSARPPPELDRPRKRLWLPTMMAAVQQPVGVQPGTGKRRRLLADAEKQLLHSTYMCYNGVYADLWATYTRDYYFNFWWVAGNGSIVASVSMLAALHYINTLLLLQGRAVHFACTLSAIHTKLTRKPLVAYDLDQLPVQHTTVV